MKKIEDFIIWLSWISVLFLSAIMICWVIIELLISSLNNVKK
jgi:hypothetical protein